MRNHLKGTIHGETRELEPFNIYLGTVEQSDARANTFAVRVDHGRVLLEHCQWGAAIVSGMLGIKVNYLPPPNTRVLLVYQPGGSVVVGSVPSAVPYTAGVGSRTITGQGDAMDKNNREALSGDPDKPRNLGASPPDDLLEGEFDMTNLLGVGLTLLTGLAKLSAGDLAKVEVSLLNDLVRIVSMNFKHFSAFGNFEIYNDGRLNVRWGGTSYDHESWGKATESETKVTATDDTEIKLGEIDALHDTLRERFTQFVGFLGDFVNTYVTDPAVALGEAAQARSGKFRCHVNNDGSLLVQSAADIVLERVCRIPVPIERKRWDDPEGTRAEEYAKLARGPLKAWKYDPNPANIFHAAYQLRHYARWLSGLHGLARFHQSPKDWRVPSEADTPAPDPNATEADKTETNPEQDQIDTYATVRIMRDGSIVVLDGYGSAVLLGGGNVQISAARHLTLEAAGDLTLVAGQNLNLKARRSIEAVASQGGLTLKAKAWLRQLSTHGSIWLRSDAPDPAAEGYTAPTPDNPDEDPVPEVLPSAIVVQTARGRVAVEAKNALDLSVKARDLPDGTDAGITLRADDGTVQLHALKAVQVDSRTADIKLRAGGSLVVAARNFLNALTGAFDVNNTMTVRHGMVDMLKLTARQVISRLVMSQKLTMAQHGNHVAAIPTGEETSAAYTPQNFGLRDGDDVTQVNTARDLFAYQGPPLRATDASGNRKPGFNDSYVTEQIETLTQQRLRLEDDSEARADYATWSWAQDRLVGEMASEHGYPWPGNRPQDLQLDASGHALHTPSSVSYNLLANESPALQKRDKQFRYRKHSST